MAMQVCFWVSTTSFWFAHGFLLGDFAFIDDLIFCWIGVVLVLSWFLLLGFKDDHPSLLGFFRARLGLDSNGVGIGPGCFTLVSWFFMDWILTGLALIWGVFLFSWVFPAMPLAWILTGSIGIGGF